MQPIFITQSNCHEYLNEFISDPIGISVYPLGAGNRLSFPYVIDGVLFSILKTGFVEGRINGVFYHIEAPAITFFPAGQLMEQVKSSEEKESVQIFMSREYVSGLQLEYSLFDVEHVFDVPTFKLTYPQLNVLLSYCEKIRKIIQENRSYKYKHLNAVMTAMAYDDIMLLLNDQISSRSFSDVVEQFLQTAKQQFREEKAIQYYAEKCNKSVSQLERILKKETGRSIVQWLDYFRTEYAKQELKYSSSSISEIAYHSGFANQGYFARFFRQQTGMTPTEYRKNG